MRGRRRLRDSIALLLAWALSGVAQAGAGWRVQVDDVAALDVDAQQASQHLFETALARLPPAWREAGDLDVRVQWRDDLPAQVHGRSVGDRLLLRRDLLDGGPDAPSHAALAAVMHELAHRYDRSPYGGLSRDPRLLDLAGWPQRPLRFGLRTRASAMTDRSPDLYETASPAEFVAVNLEHFLLDPDYACRRPALHAYFAAHFGWSPPGGECDATLPFLSADATDEAAAPVLDLDPARVWAVDYLFAEGNTRPMSRWGHSMLRLVVCAPGRAPGPDCRYDLDHHRVLSFRAFVDDVQISSLRGLTGRYPSRLFVLPMGQVIDEYTRVELRGLQSIPLRLSPGEIATLLERAASLHWSYDGRYRFVDNNCAVETWALLATGVPRLDGPRLRSVTPNGLLRRLAHAGIADTAVLGDRDAAVRLGHYFPSADREFQALLDIARGAQPLPVAGVDAWLDLDPDLRAPAIERAGQRDGAALLVLEHAALRRQELQLRDALKRRLFDPRAAAAASAPEAALRALLDAGHELSRPALLLAGHGYGLPQRAERDALRRDADALATRLRGLHAQLEDEARGALTVEERRRLETGERNIAMLGERLRTLHRQAGGLRLD